MATMADPVLIAEAPFFSGLRREIARSIGATLVLTGPPPSGYADLIVYQYNVPPGPKPEDPRKLPAWEEQKKNYEDDYFVLPDSIKPIRTVRDLLQVVERVCHGGKRLRQLRVMGHGNVGQARFGDSDLVTASSLHDPITKQKTQLAETLEKLNEWLDPNISIVILDHCLTGLSDKFLVTLSDLWGGVAVRAFTYYQGWEAGEIQVGTGPFRQCKGNACHSGYEYHPDQIAYDPGQ